MPCYRFSVAYTANPLLTIFCIFLSEKRASDKTEIAPPSHTMYLFFMLFLMCYQALNYIKKPQCIEGLKISERTNAFLQHDAKRAPFILTIYTLAAVPAGAHAENNKNKK